MCVSFSQIPEVKTCLVKLLLNSNHTMMKKESRKRSNTVACENVSSPFLSVLDWACQSADVHSAATMAALDFLKEIFEVVCMYVCMYVCIYMYVHTYVLHVFTILKIMPLLFAD